MTARQPPEWGPHRAVWTAWPSDPSLWKDALEPARVEVAALVLAIVKDGGEAVHLLVDGEEAEASARELFSAAPQVVVERAHFGDIWLRDTGPLFLGDGSAAAFRFNGWGGKYVLDGDDAVAAYIADAAGAQLRRHDWVLEGGAVEVDGSGRAIATRQCLLNENRNPDLDEAAVERRLKRDLGIDEVIWLEDGLAGDHTDGHVDNLARFVAEGVVAVPEADGTDDPNADVYARARKALEAAGLEVRAAPSPGRIEDEDGKAVPASYMNFLITNTRVLVPIYGRPNDEVAVAAIGGMFPGRDAIGLEATNILTGGGSLHCITQQQPKLRD